MEELERLAKLSDVVRTILDIPHRYTKAVLFLTKGYDENLREIVSDAISHKDQYEHES